MLRILLGVLAAYVIGSVPTSFLVGKLKGIDVRRVGSGNVGATNVLRSVGKLPALFTLLVDILKGVIPVTLVAGLFFSQSTPVSSGVFRVLLGLGAVLGHSWSIFLKFKGGKGVATSCGVLGALLPKETAIAVAVFFIVLWLTKYVSLGSILLSLTVPIIAALSGRDIELVILAVTLCILITYRHKPNIKRLLSGTENEIGKK